MQENTQINTEEQQTTILHGELSPDLKSHNEIYLLMEKLAESIRNGNLDDIMSYYADDIVAFDMMPPLSIKGMNSYTKNWKEFTGHFIFPVNYTFKHEKIEVCGDLAVVRALVNSAGTSNSSETIDMWMRSTIVFKRMGGEWKIIHEHTSVPFDEKLKGMTTLTPDGVYEH